MKRSSIRWVFFGFFCACDDELLPNESVLGVDIPAVVLQGSALSQYGAAVDVHPDSLQVLIGAPGNGAIQVVAHSGEQVWQYMGDPGLGQKVWWFEDDVLAWAPGDSVYMVTEQGSTAVFDAARVTAIDLCEDGSFVTSTGLGDAVDCGSVGVLRSECEGASCVVSTTELNGDGARLIGETTPGSAVAWMDGGPCWGNARLEDDPSPGTIHCEDGLFLEGLDGDHLGVALDSGLAAGVFNKWQVPARARIQFFDQTAVWSIERAAERSRLAVSVGGGVVAIGVPGFGSEFALEGQVFIVDIE